MVHPYLKSTEISARTPESRLEEAVGLARAIELEVRAARLVPLQRRRPGTLLGEGSVKALGDEIAAEGIAVAILDSALTPVQQRNLERAWKCKVIDRTGLILEIFGERAQTREGRIQVELAHLSYQRSRLVRSWTHLERQRGGYGFLGGPGETQIEADRRQIGERILKLKRELEGTKRTRGLHRDARRRVPYPVAALVGYTNAGKSTLFNRLTGAAVRAEDLLFATLDPTMRRVALPSGRTIILSDTVGFVSDLPTDLVAAFRATLEEVLAADFIIHVRDISHPDTEAQKDDVLAVLHDLGVNGARPAEIVEVANKIDRLSAPAREVVRNRAARQANAVALSAVTGEGCGELLSLLDTKLAVSRRIVELAVDLADGAAIAWLYRHGEVVSRRDDEGTAHFEVGLADADLARFRARAGLSHTLD
ncbi:MAG TPA: GTPase HflX [Alphaproteobacteria bacterium]